MNKLKIGLIACTLSAGPLAFGADYTYTVGPEGLSMAVTDVPTDATTVTKNGTGVLTFTGKGGPFTGKIIVEQGTVKAEAYAFASGSSVEVKAGATWDMAGGGEQWRAPTPKTFTIAGAGDTANGYAAAFKRSSGSNIRSGMSLTLAADATVEAAVQHNFGSVSLQNHKLTKIGSGTWDAYGDVKFVPDGEEAAIEIKKGNIMLAAGYPFSKGGTASNVLTLHDGVSLIQYPQWGPTYPWKLNVAGNATLKTQSARNGGTAWPTWAGPIELTGGNLKIDTKTADYQFNITGSVTATGPYGIIGILPGASTVSGPVVVTNVANTKSGTLTFAGDVTLGAFTNAVGKNDASACGTIVFKGNVTQRNAALASRNDRGSVIFDGGERVEILGAFGDRSDKGDTGGNQPTGTYAIVNVGYFHHPNMTTLSGTFAGPQALVVSNSVYDCGNNYVIAGNNYSHGRVAYLESTVTNCLAIGGYNFDSWPSRGSAWVRNSKMTVLDRSAGYEAPLTVGTSPSGYGYLQVDGSTVTVPTKDIHFGSGGSAYARLTNGSTMTFKSSLKFAQGTAGYGDLLLSGGSSIEQYQFVFGNGVLALEGEGTSISTGVSNGCDVNPWSGSTYVALNDGATIHHPFGGLNENQTCPWHLSVNGGILRPNWKGEFFGSQKRAPASFVVGEKGIVIDTSNGTGTTADEVTTFCLPMAAPTGMVVTAIALPTDEAYAASTYWGPAKVTITGAGVGAAALALYDFEARRITGIKVVAGGTGYDEATTATILSADGKATYACAVTVAAAPATGAGLVKRGEHNVRLTQANTYKGPTKVEGGALYVDAGALPAGSALAVSNGALLDLRGNAFATPSLSAGGTLDSGTLTTSALALTTESRMTITSAANLHLADGAAITLAGDLSALDKTQKYALVSGPIVLDGKVTIPALADDWKLSVKATGITLKQDRGLAVIIR